MYIGRKTLPLSFKLEDSASLLEGVLKKKNWLDFTIGEIKLVYRPFFLFEFKVKKEKAVLAQGKNAVNPFTKELNLEIAKLFDEKNAELSHELPKEYPIEVEKIKVDEEYLKALMAEKIAASLKEKMENVEILKTEKVYAPIWQAFIAIRDKNYLVELNAASGMVLNADKVPAREKGFVEITGETLRELQQPKAWLKYAVEIVDDAKNVVYRPKAAAAAETQIIAPPVAANSVIIVSAILIIILVLLGFLFFFS